jgi:hypothetical protein
MVVETKQGAIKDVSHGESAPRSAVACASGPGSNGFFACLIMILPQKANAAPTSSPQPTTPPGWLTYTNPLFGYRIAYPPSWHASGGDPRFNQHFTNMQLDGAGGDFPRTGTNVKVDVLTFNKPSAQPVYDWLLQIDADLWSGGPSDAPEWVPPIIERNRTIAEFPAIVLRWDSRAPRVLQEFLDAGPLVYEISAYWSTGADPQLIQQMVTSFQIVGTPNLS